MILTVNQPTDVWKPAPDARLGRLTVLRNSAPRGFGANHNRAIRHCTEPFCAVVNPDIRISGNPFRLLSEALADDRSCVMVAPIQTV